MNDGNLVYIKVNKRKRGSCKGGVDDSGEWGNRVLKISSQSPTTSVLYYAEHFQYFKTYKVSSKVGDHIVCAAMRWKLSEISETPQFASKLLFLSEVHALKALCV